MNARWFARQMKDEKSKDILMHIFEWTKRELIGRRAVIKLADQRRK